MPAATYLKRTAFASLESRPELPAEIAAQLADLDRVLRTVANNVNQMARHSNRIGRVLDENEPLARVAELDALLRTTLKKMAKGSG